MVEQEKTQEEKVGEEVTAQAQDDGVKPETVSELDRADQIAERQKRENDRREALLVREENLEARKRVGGDTSAGQAVAKKKEDTDEEFEQKLRDGKVDLLE